MTTIATINYFPQRDGHIAEIGFDVVDLGGLAQSWRVDPGHKGFVTRQTAGELRANAAAARRS